jgi:hypothetical protein
MGATCQAAREQHKHPRRRGVVLGARQQQEEGRHKADAQQQGRQNRPGVAAPREGRVRLLERGDERKPVRCVHVIVQQWGHRVCEVKTKQKKV